MNDDRLERVRAQDIAWALVAAAFVGGAVYVFALVLADYLAEHHSGVASVARLLLGLLLLGVPAFWLIAGAWRRTVWGCPFSHTEPGACPRHRPAAMSDAEAFERTMRVLEENGRVDLSAELEAVFLDRTTGRTRRPPR